MPAPSDWNEKQRLQFETEYTSYMLPYELPNERTAAAWTLVKQHTVNNFTGQGLSHRLSLEPSMIQALYALQLELDATLPVPIITFLRLDLDYRLRQLERLGPIQRGGVKKNANPLPQPPSSTILPPATPRHCPTLLIGIAHGEELKPMMTSSSVSAICRLSFLSNNVGKGAAPAPIVVESGPCRYETASYVAHWHQMFMFDVTEEMMMTMIQGNDLANKKSPLLQIECYEKVAFIEFSCGSNKLSHDALLCRENEVVNHEVPLVQVKPKHAIV